MVKNCPTTFSASFDFSQKESLQTFFFYRKHPTRQFYKISVLGGMVSWKIVSVLTKFWESSPGKFDLFLWYFFLLNILLNILQEHIRFSRRRKYHMNISNFPWDLVQNFVRTHKIFQEKEIHQKKRSNFPGELSQNFVRTDTIFEKRPYLQEQIYQNCLIGWFRIVQLVISSGKDKRCIICRFPRLDHLHFLSNFILSNFLEVLEIFNSLLFR